MPFTPCSQTTGRVDVPRRADVDQLATPPIGTSP
jgi:hypothetical protein